jgi:hypothetical protein
MFILVLLKFAKTSFLFLFLVESAKILARPRESFPAAAVVVVQTEI